MAELADSSKLWTTAPNPDSPNKLTLTNPRTILPKSLEVAMLAKDTYKSPFGEIILLASSKGIRKLVLKKAVSDSQTLQELKKIPTDHSNGFIEAARKQLDEYFAGSRQIFDLPLDIQGTDFQKRAWRELSKIPYGKTISYQTQARKLGSINKCRAVGSANGRNPVAIIIPCHRVVAKNGTLGGFGWGLDVKKTLLQLEAKNASRN